MIERVSWAEEILEHSPGGWEEGYFERCCSIHTAGRRWTATGRWLRGRWQHLPPVGPQVPQDLQETESFLPSFTLPVSSPSSQRHSQHLRKPPVSFAWAPLRSASLHPQLVCSEIHNLLFVAKRKQLTTGATCDLTAWKSKGYQVKGHLCHLLSIAWGDREGIKAICDHTPVFLSRWQDHGRGALHCSSYESAPWFPGRRAGAAWALWASLTRPISLVPVFALQLCKWVWKIMISCLKLF